MALIAYCVAPVAVLLMLATAASADYISAVQGLVSRIAPSHNATFKFEVIPAADGMDVWELDNHADGTSIVVRGNNGVSMAAGLGWYLRYVCHTQYSWTGDNMALPAVLPRVPSSMKRTVATSQWSYYMNVCTLSYSTTWWDWPRWQREIDWMALQGINMPLAFTGQEYVWRLTFNQLGFSDDDLKGWFSGPAFLAWYRMGNLQGFGGPLPNDWMDSQYKLQLQILERERSFGMTPVLPMFAGHVPDTIVKRYPNASITHATDWGDFDAEYGTYLLEPTDPLFAVIGQKFIEVQTSVYGTDHFYNGDIYNEQTPKTSDPVFLTTSSKAVWDGVHAGDKDAIWIMQAWFLVNDGAFWHEAEAQAYLAGVPDDRLVMLDLTAELFPVWNRFDSFYGKRFIWNSLHNYGGRPGLFGNLSHMLHQPHIDRAQARPGSFSGVGLAMEAIGQNYLVYEATLEARWRSEGPSTDQWLADNVRSRYGSGTPSAALSAWATLAKAHYAGYTDAWDMNESLIECFPYLPTEDIVGYSATGGKLVLEGGTMDDTLNAWTTLASEGVAAKLRGIETYTHDLTDVGHEYLQNVFRIYRDRFYQAFQAKNAKGVVEYGDKMLALLKDVDTLLASDKFSLLGTWVNMARAQGTSAAEKNLFEYNARNQITIWGAKAAEVLDDYARKAWAGLTSNYYYARWEQLITYVEQCVQKGTKYNKDTVRASIRKVEYAFSDATDHYTDVPVGDAVAISRALIAKYKL